MKHSGCKALSMQLLLLYCLLKQWIFEATHPTYVGTGTHLNRAPSKELQEQNLHFSPYAFFKRNYFPLWSHSILSFVQELLTVHCFHLVDKLQ